MFLLLNLNRCLLGFNCFLIDFLKISNSHNKNRYRELPDGQLKLFDGWTKVPYSKCVRCHRMNKLCFQKNSLDLFKFCIFLFPSLSEICEIKSTIFLHVYNTIGPQGKISKIMTAFKYKQCVLSLLAWSSLFAPLWKHLQTTASMFITLNRLYKLVTCLYCNLVAIAFFCCM